MYKEFEKTPEELASSGKTTLGNLKNTIKKRSEYGNKGVPNRKGAATGPEKQVISRANLSGVPANMKMITLEEVKKLLFFNFLDGEA